MSYRYEGRILPISSYASIFLSLMTIVLNRRASILLIGVLLSSRRYFILADIFCHHKLHHLRTSRRIKISKIEGMANTVKVFIFEHFTANGSSIQWMSESVIVKSVKSGAACLDLIGFAVYPFISSLYIRSDYAFVFALLSCYFYNTIY
jgi:hypothetical protein